MKLNANYPFENDAGFLQRYVANDGRRYVYGRTKEAEHFIEAVPCDYVIDDFTNERSFCGKSVVRLDDVPDGSSILSAVIHRPVTIHNILKCKDVDFSSYYWVQANEEIGLPEVEYWQGARGHFQKNRQRYERLFSELGDDESKSTLVDVISFRETGNLRNMLSYSNRLNEMYFEDFFSLPDEACFYDLGALDGKNSIDFVKKHPGSPSLVIVEPLPEYFDTLRSLFMNIPNRVFQCAVSSESGYSNFNIAACNASSSLSESPARGGLRVRVRTIDEIYKKTKMQPSFIKMDIEGAELGALKGAREVIADFIPVMAVSVYHHPDHILEAYELLKEEYPGYRFYLRHYTEGFAETVLFAVP